MVPPAGDDGLPVCHPPMRWNALFSPRSAHRKTLPLLRGTEVLTRYVERFVIFYEELSGVNDVCEDAVI